MLHINYNRNFANDFFFELANFYFLPFYHLTIIITQKRQRCNTSAEFGEYFSRNNYFVSIFEHILQTRFSTRLHSAIG